MKRLKKTLAAAALALLAAAAPSCDSGTSPLEYNERLVRLQTTAYQIDDEVHGQFENRFWAEDLSPDDPAFKELLERNRQRYSLVLDSLAELRCEGDSVGFGQSLGELCKFLLNGLDGYYLTLARDKDALDSVQRAYNLRYRALEEEFVLRQEIFAKRNDIKLN